MKYGIKDKEKKEKYKMHVGWGIILLVCVSSVFINRFGSTNIGSPIEKSEYSAKYYIHLYPENSKSRNYKVPALISSEMIERDDEPSERVYHLEKVFWPNGRVLTFYEYKDNVTCGEDGLQLGKKTTYQDDMGRYWQVELTNQKVR
jgi:hypothetical protein